MNRRDWVWLTLLAVVFLAWHVPLMYRTAAGQDEAWYGVTGMAILRTGLPHVPYVSSDDPRSVCYGLDVALYTLPPLNFYFQAMVHLALGKGLGPARLASTIAGLAAVFLVYALGRLWFHESRGALLGATIYAFSRLFLFPATMARPDMAAAALGLLAVWWSARFELDPRRRFLAAAGAAAGMSMLAHPFGIVPAMQIGLWILGRSSHGLPRRLLDASTYTGVALGVLCLWLPLIALHPDLFSSQFLGNMLGRAGPRSAPEWSAPLALIGFRCRLLWRLLKPPQAVLLLLGMTWSLFRTQPTGGKGAFRYHVWSSLLLLTLFEGRHPTLGYYVYPAAFASLAVGMLASKTAAWAERRLPARTDPRGHAVPTVLVLLLLLMVLLPGAGLKTLAAHLRHWNDPAYDAHAVARSVLADLPAGAVTAADTYVIDLYLAGRPVIEAFIEPDPRIRLCDVRDKPFEFAVFGPMGLRRTRPRMTDLILLKTYGDHRDPFACYAELYLHRAAPAIGSPHPPSGGSPPPARGMGNAPCERKPGAE